MSGPQAKYKQIPEEELRKIVSESTSMAQVIEKLGYSCLTGSAHASLKKYFEELNIDTSHFTGQGWNKNNFDYSRFQKGKKVKNALNAIIFLRGKKCEKCHNTEWLGSPIPLQIHHIDGDHLNNELSNLMLLCPNCHALTNNYCGKNRSKATKYTEEQFVNALRNSCNIRQALISMGIHYTAKCYYELAYELIDKYNITFKEESQKSKDK